MDTKDLVLVGHGPIHVIALHGWFGHARSWGHFPGEIDVETFTYAFIDYRGYGSRRDREGTFSIGEIAKDTLALADGLGWDRFALLGPSMGGKAMQAVSVLAPERITAMVGITPVPPTPVEFDASTRTLFESAARSVEARIGIIDTTTGNRLGRAWLARMAQDSIEHSEVAAFAAYFQAWADTDLSGRIAGIEIPTLVLVGEHDPSLTAALMEETYGRLFLNVEIEVIGNAGHYPMNEAPVDLATRVESFLAGLAGRI
jgi:pimeloyl-ACP methyl ester carboxylesterase